MIQDTHVSYSNSEEKLRADPVTVAVVSVGRKRDWNDVQIGYDKDENSKILNDTKSTKSFMYVI